MRFLRLLVLVLALATLSAPAFAEDVPALGNLRMILVNGLTSFDTLALPAVRLESCEVTTPVDWIVGHCGVASGSAFTVTTAAGEATTIPLRKLDYFMKPQRQLGAVHEYHYTGDWTKVVNGVTLASEAKLVVWYYTSAPNDVRGFLEITKYNVSQSFQGARE